MRMQRFAGLGLMAWCAVGCGAGVGSYLGTETTKDSSGNKQEDTVVVRLVDNSKSGADAYLVAESLPCGPVPLESSGSGYRQADDVNCESHSSRTSSGSTNTSTTISDVKDVRVKLDGSGPGKSSIEVSGRIEVRTGSSSSTPTVTEYEFAGDRMSRD